VGSYFFYRVTEGLTKSTRIPLESNCTTVKANDPFVKAHYYFRVLGIVKEVKVVRKWGCLDF